MPNGRHEFQVLIFGEARQVTMGENATRRVRMYDDIGYIKVGQLDRVPLCAADDILCQRLHVQVERLDIAD